MATEKVSQQMDSICQEYSWLSDVWRFIRSRKGSQRENKMLADEFEVNDHKVRTLDHLKLMLFILGYTESASQMEEPICGFSV